MFILFVNNYANLYIYKNIIVVIEVAVLKNYFISE